MTDVLFLAWKYVAYYRLKTAVLIGSITIIVYLPAGLNILVSHSARELTTRAETTPLLIGAKGSPLELVLNSLYFESDVPPPLRFAEVQRVRRSGLADAIPLHTRFQTRHGPIVGTSLEYFEFRELTIATGRQIGMLGECVLGAEAARVAGVKPGDSVISKPESVFDITGVYPLKMQVVGILAPVGTPDDRAVFTDVKTAWVIEGLAHGHDDLREPSARSGVLRKEGDRIIANASVVQYNEITPDNVASFHFHGSPAEFPVSSVLAVPRDEKSKTLLQGRYLGDNERAQVVEPAGVMHELLETILTVRRWVIVAVSLVALATLATMTLVFVLSLQLRRREIETMTKIGASRLRIAATLAAEILVVFAAGVMLAGMLSVATSWFATSATRLLVRMS